MTMCLLTKYYFSNITVTNTSQSFKLLTTRWWQKPASINMEQNKATVTLCIQSNTHAPIFRVAPCMLHAGTCKVEMMGHDWDETTATQSGRCIDSFGTNSTSKTYMTTNYHWQQQQLLLHPFNGLFSKTTWVSRYYKGKPHTHTHPFNGPFSGTTRESRYQKGKPIWILLKQETVSSSGIS